MEKNERIPLNTDLPEGLREDFDVARARRGRIKVNVAVEQAIKTWMTDAEGVAPLLMTAYYDETNPLNGQIRAAVRALKAKNKVEAAANEPGEEAAKPGKRRSA